MGLAEICGFSFVLMDQLALVARPRPRHNSRTPESYLGMSISPNMAFSISGLATKFCKVGHLLRGHCQKTPGPALSVYTETCWLVHQPLTPPQEKAVVRKKSDDDLCSGHLPC